jgi:hypothetical protein
MWLAVGTTDKVLVALKKNYKKMCPKRKEKGKRKRRVQISFIVVQHQLSYHF